MSETLNKKRRLERQLSSGEDESARDEASRDSATLLHARNRALATNLYVYKRKLTALSIALERANSGKSQLEDAVSVFNRRLAHLESDVNGMLAQLGTPIAGLGASLWPMQRERPLRIRNRRAGAAGYTLRQAPQHPRAL